MEVTAESNSWTDELASLVDTGIRFTGDSIGVPAPEFSPKALAEEETETESLKDQIKEFAKAGGEMVVELGRGCRDVLQQTILTDDSYIVKKTRGPLAEVSEKLRFLNELLPEDRDPAHVWPIIFSVSVIALAVLSPPIIRHDGIITTVKKVSIHPPSAIRLLLPDGRYMAYQETGVPADKARYSLIVPHSFLSSRLTGILGIKSSLLEEFGVRLISYDLPGFGESDPHHNRTLNSSAMDVSHLADSVGVQGKFWILGYSSGSLHAWAALKYIPDKVAGAAMLAPFVNPYDPGMTKEMSRTWENWTRRRKLLYYLARRFPKFLNYFYHRTFLSGKHGPIDKWLAFTLGKKDKDLVETPAFGEKWQRDVEESIRRGDPKPFVEEAVLQVSNWGFSLSDLQVQRKCPRKGIVPWLQFIYGQPDCELTGYHGPIHIWQGMNDTVVPPSMTDYIARVLPTAYVHRLPEEGHLSYFSLCNECHRKIFSTLFGKPRGPVDTVDNTLTEDVGEEAEDDSARANQD